MMNGKNRGQMSPRLNTLEGNPVQPQYHLPELRGSLGMEVGRNLAIAQYSIKRLMIFD